MVLALFTQALDTYISVIVVARFPPEYDRVDLE
jgi:hypothetical protein